MDIFKVNRIIFRYAKVADHKEENSPFVKFKNITKVMIIH